MRNNAIFMYNNNLLSLNDELFSLKIALQYQVCPLILSAPKIIRTQVKHATNYTRVIIN